MCCVRHCVNQSQSEAVFEALLSVRVYVSVTGSETVSEIFVRHSVSGTVVQGQCVRNSGSGSLFWSLWVSDVESAPKVGGQHGRNGVRLSHPACGAASSHHSLCVRHCVRQ